MSRENRRGWLAVYPAVPSVMVTWCVSHPYYPALRGQHVHTGVESAAGRCSAVAHALLTRKLPAEQCCSVEERDDAINHHRSHRRRHRRRSQRAVCKSTHTPANDLLYTLPRHAPPPPPNLTATPTAVP